MPLIVLSSEQYQALVDAVSIRFRTFGGGRDTQSDNPIAVALNDKPVQFAAGVDVEDVVRFVITAANILAK